jgi:orotidine-5'-phosphate decarboxylase
MPSRIVAVTILTSFDATTIPPGFEQPFHAVLVALKLLAMAEGAGAAGIVCAAPELPALRQMHGKPFFAVTPGIRPAGAAAQDQKRVATVTEAVRAGASVLVLGRAVTSAADPRAALERARAECLAAALAEPAQP